MLEKEAVNRYIMGKSHLLPETKLDSVGAVLRDIIALDANDLDDAYFSLYQRAKNFNVQAFEKGLYQGTSMARVKGLKNYMQIIPQEYLSAVYSVTMSDREAAARNILKTWGITDDEYRKVESAIIQSLGEKEKTLVQLKRDLSNITRDIVRKKKEKAMNVSIVAQAMMDRWVLLRGGIGRQPGENPGRFSLFKNRFNMKLDMDRGQALSMLAKLYVREYGPVSAEDLAWWLGVTLNEASTAIRTLDNITGVEISGIQGQFYMPAGSTLPGPSPGASVIFLPKDDPYVKAYYNVARFVPEGYKVMTKFGESESIILINGAAWGKWSIEKETLRDVCSIRMFDGYPKVKGFKENIKKAAEDAGRFYTGKAVEAKADF